MFIDRSIDPTADQVRALRDATTTGPVTMVNLLKYRAEARYDAGTEPPCSGREAYARYKHAFTQTVGEVSQAKVLFQASVTAALIDRQGRPRRLPAELAGRIKSLSESAP